MNSCKERNIQGRSVTMPVLHRMIFACHLMAALAAMRPVSAFSAIARQPDGLGRISTCRNHQRLYSNPIRDVSAHVPLRDDDGKTNRSRRLISATTTEPKKSSAAATTAATSWWPFIASSPVDENARKVDEYLEFLDRRYHRMHDEEQLKQDVAAAKERTRFSTLKWLTKGTSDDGAKPASGSHRAAAASVYTKQQEQDALYALGVAGLASQRLLQKHHATLASSRDVVIPVQHTPGKASLSQQRYVVDAWMAPILAKLSPIWIKLSAIRTRLLQFESLQTRAALAFVAHSLTQAPAKVGRTLLKWSGGRKNLAWTITVATAMTLLLLRPLAQSIVREGVAQTRAA